MHLLLQLRFDVPLFRVLMGSALPCETAYLGAFAVVLVIYTGSWHPLLCVAVWHFDALVCVQMFVAG